jgi:hypothetical protein
MDLQAENKGEARAPKVVVAPRSLGLANRRETRLASRRGTTTRSGRCRRRLSGTQRRCPDSDRWNVEAQLTISSHAPFLTPRRSPKGADRVAP